MSHNLIKDYGSETRLFVGRAVAALVIIVALLLVLCGRLFYLQVISHRRFTTLSRDNRVKIEPVGPTRGLIYDRNGTLLAENIPSFTLEVIPEQVPNLPATLAALGKIIPISADDLKRFNEIRRHERRFDPVPLRLRLNQDEVAAFAVNRYRFPGVEVQADLIRHYPLGELTAPVVGYVGRLDETELNQVDATNYSATRYIGKTGIEKTYENLLHGTVGYQKVETNAEGRELRVLDRDPAVPGRDLMLTLDMRVQRAAYEALGNERGAVVAIDPHSGAVLALVSKPSYDPNQFVTGIPEAAYEALQHRPDRPLFNRALAGQYPPGSTIKPLMALGGLEDGVITPTKRKFCIGYYQLQGDSHRYRGWKRGGHGWVDVHKAIVQSCDIYFYDLAFNMGIDRIHAYLSYFGLGRKTGIDLTGEASGLLPSRQWKERTRHMPWFPGETLIAGIGQGFVLATPLQLASAAATLADGGRRFRPRVLQATVDPDTHESHPLPPERLPSVPIKNPANWKVVVNAMIDVVNSPHGTARRIGRNAAYVIAGKTGTAQVFGVKQDEEFTDDNIEYKLRDHALFIAFAPAKAPRIAVAVVVEHGGGGGAVAAPIARRVMDAYLKEADP